MSIRPVRLFALTLGVVFAATACAERGPVVAPEPIPTSSLTPSPTDIPTASPIPTLGALFDAKVDVGGYQLRIVCAGEGGPTVIIEAAFGDPPVESGSWRTVANEIQKTARICVYDRAGLGSSSVAPGENRTSRDMARALHDLLDNGGVPGPYVLVGHSLGGYHVRMFASLYPDEVAGIVLVDSSYPDQWSEVVAALPPESPDEPSLFKELRTVPPASLPEKMDILASADQVRATGSLGDLPLVVLTHSPTFTWHADSNVPPEIVGKIEGVWQRLQNDLAGLSSNSSHIIATKAGHWIQADEPQLVIDAILKVIDEANQRGS